jgi:hypothetical protein
VLNVVCLKAGSKYGPEYVNNLQWGVARNLSQPFRFVCLTDDPAGVKWETLDLDEPLSGWWHKVTLFKERPYGLTGRILFLDLDVVVTGSLDEMVDFPSDFAIIRDYAKPNTYNSSAFLLKVGARPQVWSGFNGDAVRRYPGDQDWITAKAPGADLWPDGWTPSYKFGQLQEARPAGAKVVVFHGQPKPHECGGWVKGAWAA